MTTDSDLNNSVPADHLQATSQFTSETAAAKSAESGSLRNNARPGLGSASQWQTARPDPSARVVDTELRHHTTNLSEVKDKVWREPIKAKNPTPSDSSDEDGQERSHSSSSRKSTRPQGKSKLSYRKYDVETEEYSSRGKVSKRDGRLNISLHQTNNQGYLAKTLGMMKHVGPGASKQMGAKKQMKDVAARGKAHSPPTEVVTSTVPRPKLNIVVMVIGSRGDIQPFIKLGKNLKECGHRVRIATHPAFKELVQDEGLEFFSAGGDPAELMAFMVKNPGLMPKMETIKDGEIGRRRDGMADMFKGFWRACINATDDEEDVMNLKLMGDKPPFVADAIIANPPSFAHIHIAERLGIPLHLMFTFPYTPTQAFPHPLANIKKSNVDPGYANFISYPLVEMMTWQGLGDLVNDFRVKTLGMEPVSTLWAPGQIYRLKVPYTYLWSPGLCPKPADWGPEIDIAGFVFLEKASTFDPPEDLVKFLDAGEPPVYLGFGSIVVDNADKFTKLIFEAVEKAGVRALVSKGWGGLGDKDHTPDNIFMLENTPHDWLFPKCSAVVHHGGAGTTAIGLKCAKPTMVVPFFGDQQFWGSMIGEAGAGTKPVPYSELTVEKLADGIKECLTEEAKQAAQGMADAIDKEGDGSKNAVTSFHRSLKLRGLKSMRCCILENQVAVWTLKKTDLRLSALAAELLVERKCVTWKQLRLIRHCEWNDFEGPGEPISGVTTSVMSTVAGVSAGLGSIPFKIAKTAKRRSMHEQRKRKSMEVDHKRKSSGMNSNFQANSVDQNRHTVQNSTQQGLAEKHAEKSEKLEDSAKGQTGGENSRDKIPKQSADDKATSEEGVGKQPNGAPILQNNGQESDGDDGSELSDDSDHNAVTAVGKDVGSGFRVAAETLLWAPMDLALSLAQGFHNAPRLYGDTTVRRPVQISGYKSGLKAAGQEFAYGVYDGVTGIVVLPYIGARANGTFGFAKGIAMGLGGFVLKDVAAVVGPFGYTLKGFHMEITKSKQPTNFIRKARIIQGQREVAVLEARENQKITEQVIHGWVVVQQVGAIIEEARSQGLIGKVRGLRTRQKWKSYGAFENVEMAEKAVAACRKGENVEKVFAQQRREMELAERPRKNVVEDIEEGTVGETDNNKNQVVQGLKA